MKTSNEFFSVKADKKVDKTFYFKEEILCNPFVKTGFVKTCDEYVLRLVELPRITS